MYVHVEHTHSLLNGIILGVTHAVTTLGFAEDDTPSPVTTYQKRVHKPLVTALLFFDRHHELDAGILG